MEFVRREKKVREKSDDIGQKMLSWPDCYYRERSPKIRLALIEEAENRGLTPEDNPFRRTLYGLRYKDEVTETGEALDLFLKSWLDLRFFYEQGDGFIFKRKASRLEEIMTALGFFLPKNQSEKNLLYQEYYHLGMLYCSICAEDKTFNSMLLGIGTISDDRQARKIAGEFRKVAVEAVGLFGQGEKYALFTQALKNAFYDMFPDYEGILEDGE